MLGFVLSAASDYAERTGNRRLASRGLEEIVEGAAARAAKDFAKADALRKEREELGIDIADSAAGTSWGVRVL